MFDWFWTIFTLGAPVNCRNIEPCAALAMKSRVPSLLTFFHSGSCEQSDKVRVVSRLPTRGHEPLVILYLVLHFSEVWKCGKVWQSQYNVTRTLCHSLLSSTLLRRFYFCTRFYFTFSLRTRRQIFNTAAYCNYEKCRTIKNDKRFVTGKSLTLSLLFHTSIPLRSVELSKEWQELRDWIKVWQYPQFVRLFHTSTPLRSVE